MNELDKIIEKNEKVLWEGKPVFLPYIVSRCIISVIIGIVMGLLILIPLYLEGSPFVFGPVLVYMFIFLFFVVLIPIYNIWAYKHIHYAITNKRVLLQSGIVGRDFKIVDFDQITNAEVAVGLVDLILKKNTGSLAISTASTFIVQKGNTIPRPYLMIHIQSPYNVFKFFKQVSHDTKTDIEFPNKYRPNTNPGYNTKLKK